MNLDLTNKKALVCGSTQGIGKAAAKELCLLGAKVVLLARNEQKLKTVASELNSYSKSEPEYIVADFSDPENLRQQVREYINKNGGFNILVNNAGGPPAGNITDATAIGFIQAFKEHLICNHYLTQECMAGMKELGYGRIINVISTSVKQPIKGLGVSNTIRAAVGNWSKTMSIELAPFGITVNNVLPGATLTARLEQIIADKVEKTGKSEREVIESLTTEIPAKRFANPEETAAAIAFLASPAAGYINGTNVVVDGGRTACL
ncbi:MAG TPA: SDR family oxidoreductase [Bacteroidia bacterium]|jgi:3-oxoacyl-[acyl-carrier protein] reductase|nr:SDR family oxidoreductase [Bacteroidia bacterium]HMU18958.1 SDR family oxidoreductase [Bacteroidia bacterium]